MAKITSLEPTRRNPDRVAVFLDGSYALAISTAAARQAGLEVGGQVDPEVIEQLALAENLEKACQSAYYFLGPRPRSEAEVARRLAEKGYDQPVIAAALTRLREYGYLDDQAFATAWIESRSRSKPRSSRLINLELRQKGVDPESIDLDSWDDDAAAWAAATRWLSNQRFADRAERDRKVSAFLLRRGFDYPVIRALLRRLESSPEP
jgi:regulatory protein